MLRELCDLEPACGWAVKNIQSPYPNPYDKTGNIRFLNPNLHPHITRLPSRPKLQVRVKKPRYYQFH